jgi:uncharacterized protein (DUF58 family)
VSTIDSIAVAETAERALRRLEWRVIRRLDGQMPGDYRTLLYGSGIDVADLREYEPGDDVRYIDWNVTARMDAPYVRTYHEDRELSAWLLLDRSASMRFGRIEHTKEQVMADLAITLARLLARGGNRVGAILFNNEVERTLPPQTGRNQTLRLLNHLRETPPESSRPDPGTKRRWRTTKRSRSGAAEAPGPTPSPAAISASTCLADLVVAASHTIKRRSLVVIISDFITEPGWERQLALLGQRHEVVAIRLYDPSEHTIPDAGIIVMEDIETGESISVDTSDPGFRSRYAAAVSAQEDALKGAARQAGVELHSISTSEDLVAGLVRIVDLRRKRRR